MRKKYMLVYTQPVENNKRTRVRLGLLSLTEQFYANSSGEARNRARALIRGTIMRFPGAIAVGTPIAFMYYHERTGGWFTMSCASLKYRGR